MQITFALFFLPPIKVGLPQYRQQFVLIATVVSGKLFFILFHNILWPRFVAKQFRFPLSSNSRTAGDKLIVKQRITVRENHLVCLPIKKKMKMKMISNYANKYKCQQISQHVMQFILITICAFFSPKYYHQIKVINKIIKFPSCGSSGWQVSNSHLKPPLILNHTESSLHNHMLNK